MLTHHFDNIKNRYFVRKFKKHNYKQFNNIFDIENIKCSFLYIYLIIL